MQFFVGATKELRSSEPSIGSVGVATIAEPRNGIRSRVCYGAKNHREKKENGMNELSFLTSGAVPRAFCSDLCERVFDNSAAWFDE